MKTLKRLLEMPFSTRQSRLASSRSAMCKGEFVAKTSSTALGRSAANLLWEKLQSEKVVDEFSPYPDDDLLKVYGLADEDLDEDVILAIIQQIGTPVPSAKVLKAFGPVNTPADIVRLIEANEASQQGPEVGKAR